MSCHVLTERYERTLHTSSSDSEDSTPRLRPRSLVFMYWKSDSLPRFAPVIIIHRPAWIVPRSRRCLILTLMYPGQESDAMRRSEMRG